jgi:hypothetical protein
LSSFRNGHSSLLVELLDDERLLLLLLCEERVLVDELL